MASPIKISDVFRLHKALGKVTFADVVRGSCGHEIIPIDQDDDTDAELLRHLNHSLTSLVKLTDKAGQRFRGNRINDVGKKFETMIEEEIKKTSVQITKLGSSGYPDFELLQQPGDRLTYLEIKLTGNVRKTKTQHRMFYYSSGRKVKADARHLLVQIQMQEEENKIWKVVSWELRDLMKLRVQLKTEFNANFAGLGECSLLDSTDTPHTKKKGGEQLRL